MRKTETGSSLATTILAICAFALTGLLVRRELATPVVAPPDPKAATIDLPDWGAVNQGGHSTGPDSAPIQLVVFEDYECPACQYFATVTLPALVTDFPGKVRVIHRHAPLPYHRFAYAAARAVECAADQGKFEEMRSALFRAADSLGLKPFAAFAAEAGVQDAVGFATCNAKPDSIPRISVDLQTAIGIGGTGTPTVAMNGRLYTTVPSRQLLSADIEGILEKRQK